MEEIARPEVCVKTFERKTLRRYKPTPERLQIIQQIPKDSSILDAGTGDGQYLPHLASKGSVVGLDNSLSRLGRAKRSGFPLVLSGIKRMPFGEGSFDIVWCSEVIEHLPDLKIFDELERVARRLIIATMPNPGGPYYWWDPTHSLRYSVASLQDFLSERSGWRYIIHGLGLCLPFRVPRLVWSTLYRLTYDHPSCAFNILILGVRKPKKKGR